MKKQNFGSELVGFFSENISFLTIQKPFGFGRVSQSGSGFFGSSIKSRVRVSACKKKSSSGFCRVRPRPVASLLNDDRVTPNYYERAKQFWFASMLFVLYFPFVYWDYKSCFKMATKKFLIHELKLIVLYYCSAKTFLRHQIQYLLPNKNLIRKFVT